MRLVRPSVRTGRLFVREARLPYNPAVISTTSSRKTLAICAATLLVCAGAAAEAAFPVPSPGTVLVAGQTTGAAWTLPCDRENRDEAELVLSLDDGLTFPIRVTEEMPSCAASHRWRVPDVGSRRARLGLRRGREGRAEAERIVLVSGPFVIEPDGHSDDSGLTRGAAEWWTDQALFAFAAEDFLAESLGRVPASVRRPAADSEIDDSGHETLPSGAAARGRISAVRSTGRPASRAPAVPVPGIDLPLRL